MAAEIRERTALTCDVLLVLLRQFPVVVFPVIDVSDSLISHQRMVHIADYVLLIATALIVN